MEELEDQAKKVHDVVKGLEGDGLVWKDVAEKAVKHALDAAERFTRFATENEAKCNEEILDDIKRLRKFFKAQKYHEHQSKPVLNSLKTLLCVVNEQFA